MYNAKIIFEGENTNPNPTVVDSQTSTPDNIKIPHIPPETTPKFNIFFNKKLHNLNRLESTLHYWSEIQGIDKDLKLKIYSDILKSLNKAFRDKKIKIMHSKYNVKRKAISPPIVKNEKKTGWSALLDSPKIKNPAKKIKIK